MLTLQDHIKEAQRELYKRNFYEFVKGFWDVVIPETYIDSWHIKYLCDEIQDMVTAVINNEPLDKTNLVINISPGTSKSTIASVMAPVWCWVNDPTLKVLTGSHTNSLALDLAVKSRDILRSNEFRTLYPHIELKGDTDTKSQYANTKGGVRVSSSVGSSVIGQHFHIIIVDDPIKTTATELEMDRAWKWLSQELSTRKIDKQNCPTILIMQRLHPSDPAGRMNDSKRTKNIKLPAMTSDSSTVKPESVATNYTEVDGILYMDTKRLGKDLLDEMKLTLGSTGFSNQFLQSPEPLDGGVVKKDWLPIQDKTPQLYSQLNDRPIHFFIDSAYTADTSNDPSGIIGVKELNGQLYVITSDLQWMAFPDLVKHITSFVYENGYTPQSKIYLEQKASGISLTQQLKRETNLNVIEDQTLKTLKGSKLDRLQAVSPQLESKRVYLIRGNWNESYIEQMTSKKPLHDEFWDCTVMAIQNLLLNQNKGTGEYAVRRAKSRS